MHCVPRARLGWVGARIRALWNELKMPTWVKDTTKIEVLWQFWISTEKPSNICVVCGEERVEKVVGELSSSHH